MTGVDASYVGFYGAPLPMGVGINTATALTAIRNGPNISSGPEGAPTIPPTRAVRKAKPVVDRGVRRN